MDDNWFTYDWHMEQDAAVFSVDTRFIDKAPYPNRPVLMHLRCEMRDQTPLTPKGIRHIRRIEKKCGELKALYVGYAEDALRRVMFFYTDDPRRVDALNELAEEEKYLYCEAGCSMDEQWNTYLTLLYPDAARLQTETNRRNIQLYRKKGDCITAARRVTFHVYFPAEMLVSQFAQEARLIGFAIGDTEFNPDFQEQYGIKLQRISTLEKPEVDANTTAVIYAAERYMGRLLYWESPIIPKNSPLK